VEPRSDLHPIDDLPNQIQIFDPDQGPSDVLAPMVLVRMLVLTADFDSATECVRVIPRPQEHNRIVVDVAPNWSSRLD
jgi:hypothetical protein